MTDARLEVQVDGRGAVQGSNVSVRALRNLEGQAGRVDGAFDRMQRSIFSLRGALTGLAGAFAFRELTQAIDSWNQYESRLRLVTGSAEELVFVQRRLFETAQDTRSAFGATVTLYSRVANSTRELGLAQTELIDFTRTVQQAIQIGGASAQEAEAGVRQFAQALASGELRGDEFRSISENLIGLRDALVDGLNELGEYGDVTVATLREMAANGELTTEVLLRAIQAVDDQTQETFDRLPRTIGQAIQQLENDLFRVIGTTDETTEAGLRFAEAIDRVRDVINSPDFTNGISIVVEGLAFMAENMDAVVVAGTTLIGLRLGAAFGPWGAGIGAVTGALVGLIANQRIANSLGDEGEGVARRLAIAYELMAQGANEAAAAELRLVSAQGQRSVASLRISIDEEMERIEALQDELAGIEPGRATASRDELRMRELGDEIVEANQNVVRMEGNVSDLNSRMAEAARTANSLAAQLDDVATPTSNLGGLTEDLTDRYNDFVAAGNEVVRMQREIDAVLDESAEITQQLNAARIEARDAGNEALAQELMDQYEAVQESQRIQIEAIRDRYTPAVNEATSGTARLSEETDDLGASLQRVGTTLERLTEPSPLMEYLEHVRTLRGGVARAFLRMEADAIDGSQLIENSIVSAFDGASAALANFALTGELNFNRLVLTIIDGLARMAIQAAIVQPLFQALSGVLGFGASSAAGILAAPAGGVPGFIPATRATVSHAGGIVGAPGPSAIVDAGLFANAQRFHDGGMVGLRPNERPIIAEVGEAVLTQDQQRRLGGGEITFNQVINVSGNAVNQNGEMDPTAQANLARQTEQMVKTVIQREIAQQSRVGGLLNRV